MKKKIVLIGVVVIAIVAIIVIAMLNLGNKKDKEVSKTAVKIETVQEMKNVFDDIYEKLGDEFPSVETNEIDVTDETTVMFMTGLKSNKNVEALVVSEPLMSSQAYSAVLVKVSKDANIEEMKKEMIDNIDTRKWICVSAEKVYVTNYENTIFLIMASEDWAKPVYEEFKRIVNGNIGGELQKTEEI